MKLATVQSLDPFEVRRDGEETNVPVAITAVPKDALAAGDRVTTEVVDRRAFITGKKDGVSSKPPENSVGSTELIDAAVLESKLADAAVSNKKIVDQAISSSKIAQEAVTEALIAVDAITETKIKDDSISTPKIAAGAVVTEHMTADTILGDRIKSYSIEATRIASYNLTAQNANFESSIIQRAYIKDAAISNAKIANAAVTNIKIANATITDAKIRNLSASKITTGTISSQTIYVGSYGYIRSSNYYRGSRGWQIDGYGNAEFNDVTVRGRIESSTVQSTNIYSSDIQSTTFRTNGYAYVYIGGSDPYIRFYDGGYSSTLRQGYSTGLETSGSLRLGGSTAGGFLYCRTVDVRYFLNATANNMGLYGGYGPKGYEWSSRRRNSTSGYRGFAGGFFRVASSERYKSDIVPCDDMDACAEIRKGRIYEYSMEPESEEFIPPPRGADETEGEYQKRVENERIVYVSRTQHINGNRRKSRVHGLVVEREVPESVLAGDGVLLNEMVALLWKATQEIDTRLHALEDVKNN